MKFELNEYHRNVTDEELIDDVKRVASIYNKPTLTRDEYRVYGKYGLTTFVRHFGSWMAVLEMCSLQANSYQLAAIQAGYTGQSVTDSQLFEDLQRVASMLEKDSITSGEYKQYGEYSSSTIFKRFGTWNNALEKANLSPFVKVAGKRIPTEALFSEIERLWTQFGRQPTVTDVKNGYSKYSVNAFVRRFGGWNNALRAFVEYIEEDDSEINRERVEKENKQPKIKKIREEKAYINQHLTKNKHTTQREPNLRLRFKVLVRDNFRCCSCGASPATNPDVVLHVDHIKPWSKGGETVMENLQTLCSKCNLGKSDIDIL